MQFYVCFRAIWNLEAINDDKTENRAYRKIEPTTRLRSHVACPDFKFLEQKSYKCNQASVESEKFQEIDII